MCEIQEQYSVERFIPLILTLSAEENYNKE